VLLTERSEFLAQARLTVLAGSKQCANLLSVGSTVKQIANSAQKLIVEVLALLVEFLVVKIDVVTLADIDLQISK
jgi:hypothetical protein